MITVFDVADWFLSKESMTWKLSQTAVKEAYGTILFRKKQPFRILSFPAKLLR